MALGAARRTVMSAWSTSCPPSTSPHSSMDASSSARAARIALSRLIAPRMSAQFVFSAGAFAAAAGVAALATRRKRVVAETKSLGFAPHSRYGAVVAAV